MLERMPENIKKAYIISIFIIAIFFIMGIIFNCVELYFGYLIGAIISIININLLVNGVHKILYFQNNPKFRGNFEYLKRMAIFCLGMFIVGKVSQKYFESHILTNIAATGAGALNFKISYLLCHLKEKFLLSKK
jgi:ATP synthase I chain